MHPLLRIMTVISTETTGLSKACVKQTDHHSKERGGTRGEGTAGLTLAACPVSFSHTPLAQLSSWCLPSSEDMISEGEPIPESCAVDPSKLDQSW